MRCFFPCMSKCVCSHPAARCVRKRAPRLVRARLAKQHRRAGQIHYQQVPIKGRALCGNGGARGLGGKRASHRGANAGANIQVKAEGVIAAVGTMWRVIGVICEGRFGGEGGRGGAKRADSNVVMEQHCKKNLKIRGRKKGPWIGGKSGNPQKRRGRTPKICVRRTKQNS